MQLLSKYRKAKTFFYIPRHQYSSAVFTTDLVCSWPYDIQVNLIDGLMPKRCNSVALATELRLIRIKP